MKTLYDTLIKPHLEYGINLWGGTHDSFLIQLIKQQKKVIRIITNSNYNAPTKSLFTKLKILDLNNLYSLNIGKFMYKVKTESLPTTLNNNMYTLNSAIHDHNTRQRNNIFIQHRRTRKASQQINHKGPNIWQSIPNNIKDSINIKQFTHSFKIHLLSLNL